MDGTHLVNKRFTVQDMNDDTVYTITSTFVNDEGDNACTVEAEDLKVTYTCEEVTAYLATGKWVEENDALAIQVGGDHYKQFKIQPVEFVVANNLDFIQGNIIKYACRHKTKNGITDLQKVIHYAQLAIQLQYKESGMVDD
jgi:hypothetical protein